MSTVLPLVLALALVQAPPAPSGPDIRVAATAFVEARAASSRDDGRLWGVLLYGPTLFVDAATRRVVANQADLEGRLTASGEVFVGSLPPNLPVANMSVEWAGVRWAMVLWPPPDDPVERAALLLHESFHRVQPALGIAAASPANAHLDTLEGRVLMRLEWRALEAALGATGAARRRALADALAFRARRRALSPTAAGEERALELNEGLAEYTGRALTAADPTGRARELLRAAEARRSYTRSFAYASGPAYGLLLDARAARWRTGLTAASDLGDLAARAYGVRASDGPEARYGGPQVLAAERTRDAERRARAERAIARYVDGPVLVIPLRKMRVSFDPNTLEPLEGRGTVYPTMEISDEWGTLTVTGGALLAADWSSVTVPAPAEPGGASGDGWTLRLAPGWRVVPGPRPNDATLASP